MPINDYKKFAYDTQRETDAMTQVLYNLLPHYSDIAKVKRKNILNTFEEVEYYGGGDSNKPGTVLEREGEFANYIYIILSGEIHVYKKIHGLYVEGDHCCDEHPEMKLINVND